MSLTSYIQAMPKAELHVHLEGSIGPETLLTLAENNKLRLPFASVEAVKQLYIYRDFAQFAQTLLLGVKCMRREDDFALVVERLGAELARQNIRYAEVIWTPQFYLGRPYPLSAVLAALNAGRARVRRQWGVEMRWVPDLVRSVPAPMHVVGRWVSSDESIAGGTVALGLGGPEAGNPAEQFEEPFRWARDAGLFANPHAGENAGPPSVRAALEVLKATRIGHGVRAVEDSELLEQLVIRRVPLEVCPTSNLRLGVYASYAEHPLKQLVEAGCVVTINTDDPQLFGTTLNAEYLHTVQDCGLSLDQLEDAALNAVRASYLPDADKAVMLKEFGAEYGRLRTAHGLPAKYSGSA